MPPPVSQRGGTLLSLTQTILLRDKLNQIPVGIADNRFIKAIAGAAVRLIFLSQPRELPSHPPVAHCLPQ